MSANTDKNKVEKTKPEDRLKQQLNVVLIKHFRLMTFLLVMIIFIGGYFLIIQPKYNQIVKDSKLKTDELENKYSTRQKYLTQLIHLRVAYKQIDQTDKDKIEAMLPDTPQTEELISEIEVITQKNGLTLAALSVEPEEFSGETSSDPLSAVAKVKITMDVIGTDYFALNNLLRTIENNLRLIDVTSVNYLTQDKKTSLVMQAYYVK